LIGFERDKNNIVQQQTTTATQKINFAQKETNAEVGSDENVESAKREGSRYKPETRRRKACNVF
jgi:hypothetical protein